MRREHPVWLTVCVAAFGFVEAAHGGALTLSGSQLQSFSQLDGSPIDEDGAANGVLRVSSLQLQGGARLIIDVAAATIEVSGAVSLAGNSQIAPTSSPSPSTSPVIRIVAGQSIMLAGNPVIHADGSSNGGSIFLCAATDILLRGRSIVRAAGHPSAGTGGSIQLQAGNVIEMNGNAGSISADGATGGTVDLTSCGTTADAINLQGPVRAIGTAQSGGHIALSALRGGIRLQQRAAGGKPASQLLTTGATGSGTVTINAATAVSPPTPLSQPPAVVCAGSACGDPDATCACDPELRELRIVPEEIVFLDPAERQALQVIGRYSDGSEQDLTDPSTGTTYRSESVAVATILDVAIGAPIARGQTRFIAQNGGQSAAADVLVDFCRPPIPQVDPVASPTNLASVLLTGSAEPGTTIEITTPGGTVTGPVTDGRFAIDTPLGQNRRNLIHVIAIADCGARGSAATLVVSHDSREPHLFIDFPSDGAKLTNEVIDVAGRTGDLLSGFMGLTVQVNGIPAEVDVGIGNNGTYLARNVPLSAYAPTVLTATATDAAGNVITKSIEVERVAISDRAVRMESVSGNAQTAPVNQLLPKPVVVRVSHPNGTPFANKVVTFDVTRNDGRLTEGGVGPGTMLLQVRTDADGLARAFWKVGGSAGCGNNRIEVTSSGVQGTVFFCASGTPGPAAQINIGTGNMQRADAGGQAPEPLRAWVSDSCNGLPNIPVSFRVIQGGGKVNGEDEVIVPTGITGHAEAWFTLGPDRGNNLIEADFPGNLTGPATFVIYGLTRDEDQPTTFTGLVLDNSLLPIGGARVELHVGDQHLPPVMSGENGQFRIEGITSSGPSHLFVNAFNATTLNGQPIPQGSFPGLHYETSVTPNAENSLGMPVLLPPLNPNNVRPYSTTQDTVLTCEGMEGLMMIVKAGSMRLANGTLAPNGTLMALNQVHHDDVPMPMPDGAAPPFAWTLQPGGATFDPPIVIEYPNMSALPPGAIANFLSFDHDTSKFEIVASGFVSDDGSTIISDAGAGLSIAGWGCNCPPYSVTEDCEKCDSDAGTATTAALRRADTSSFTDIDIQPAPLGAGLCGSVLTSHKLDAYCKCDPANQNLKTIGHATIESTVLIKVYWANITDPADIAFVAGHEQRHVDVAAGFFGQMLAAASAVHRVKFASETACNSAVSQLESKWRTEAAVRDQENQNVDTGSDMARCAQIRQQYGGPFAGSVIAAGPDLPHDYIDIDATAEWTITLNGQTVVSRSLEAFKVANVVAADSFGPAGPGSPPDFVSDDFLRLIAIANVNEKKFYAFSQKFQIQSGETFELGPITITETPPLTLERLDTVIKVGTPQILTSIGETTQLETLGTINDGIVDDVTPRSAWTIYRTSNPGVVTVGPDGEVTARGSGRAFVTAINEGATAVTSITVALGDPLTTVEGYVQFEDGTFAAGAEVTVPGQGASTTTDAAGHFSFSGIASTLGDIRVRATRDNLVGTSDTMAPVPGGITDVGFVTLRVPATSGREFVVAFQPNFDNVGVELTLFISGDESASGEVQVPGISFSTTFLVAPGEVTAVPLPAQALTIGSDVTVNRGIHVLADRDISLYGLNRKQFTTDAFAAFPVESLGMEYRVMSHNDLGANNNRSQFAVVAAEDNTTVFITPTASTTGHPAGATYGVILNRLQVYQLRTGTNGADLTGTRIVSDKPVAVFSGHSCANLPTSGFGFCDHLCEQMPPVGAWGEQVLTLPLATRLNGDAFRILADQDATAITISGPVPVNFVLNAGQFSQRILTGNNEITSDKPVLVTQYSNGSQYDGVTSDPFMTLVPPSEQFLRGYTFSTPGSGFDLNFVNLLALSTDAAAGAVLLDGVSVPPDQFQLIGTTGFSCAKLPISVGSHTMSAPNPFGIYVYGFATDDSYGYPGGLSLTNLNP